MATTSERILGRWPVKEPVWPMDTKPIPTALLRIAPATGVEPLRTRRWRWIVPSVTAVFALFIGGNYWMSEKGLVPGTAQVARTPTDRPVPQLPAGPRLLGSQPEEEEAMAPKAAQSSVSAPSPREPHYITIAGGQTLIRIAHANHLAARAIAAANHLEPPYPLRAGSRLLVPDPDATMPPARP